MSGASTISNDWGEEIGVDDSGIWVRCPDTLERLLQQRVVVDGQVVELYQAARPGVVGRRVDDGGEDGEVRR